MIAIKYRAHAHIHRTISRCRPDCTNQASTRGIPAKQDNMGLNVDLTKVPGAPGTCNCPACKREMQTRFAVVLTPAPSGPQPQ
jgi:hypothetical protein